MMGSSVLSSIYTVFILIHIAAWSVRLVFVLESLKQDMPVWVFGAGKDVCSTPLFELLFAYLVPFEFVP